MIDDFFRFNDSWMANIDRFFFLERLQPSESQLQFPTDWDDQSRTTTGCSRYPLVN